MEEQITARAKSTNLPVSLKQVMEVCNYIRGKSVIESRKFIDDVMAFRKAVPYRRFKMNIPHQKSHTGPGRYPIKAAGFVRMVLESAVKNAENKGMKEEALFVYMAIANRGSTVWHPGRLGRRQAKRTHIEIVLAEKKEKKEAKNKPSKPKAASKGEKQ